MFDKYLFKKQLETLMEGMNTVEFSEKTGFNRTYLSKYINLKLDRPPSPELLKSISGEKISYMELMISCGYIDKINILTEDIIKIPVINDIKEVFRINSAENIEKYEYISKAEINPDYEYFYLKVKENNMINARIHEGDLVFVRKQYDVDNGDIAVVMTDDKISIKRVIKKDDIIVLQSENPDYMPSIFTKKDNNTIKIIGKVIHVKFII